LIYGTIIRGHVIEEKRTTVTFEEADLGEMTEDNSPGGSVNGVNVVVSTNTWLDVKY
jgi:hypothetical protein